MPTEMNDREPIAPSEDELAELSRLVSFLQEHDHGLSIVGPAGEGVTLTEAALGVLRRAAAVLARDRVASSRQRRKTCASAKSSGWSTCRGRRSSS